MNLRAGAVGLFGAILCVPTLLFAFGVVDVIYYIAAIVGAMYLSVIIANFEAGFLTLIFIRSSLDYVKQLTGGGEGGFNVAALVSLGLIVMGAFYLLYRRVNVFLYEEAGPFALFLGICGVSVFFSADKMLSVGDFLRMTSVFFVYVLVRTIACDERRIRRFLVVTLSSALIPVFVAYYQLATGNLATQDFESGRLLGTFYHPNAFASYLLIILVFSTALAFEKEAILSKRFLWPFVALTSVVFVMTYSRGAWIVFMLAMFVMGALRYRKIFAIVPVALALVVAAMPSVMERVNDVADADANRGNNAWEWRMKAWSDIGDHVKERPVFGHGLSMVEQELGYLAHNDYLRLMMEVGLAGLLAYAALVTQIFRKTWRPFRRHPSALVRGVHVGLLAALIAILVRQYADNTLRNTVGMMYFWIFIALARNLAAVRWNAYLVQREHEAEAARLVAAGEAGRGSYNGYSERT